MPVKFAVLGTGFISHEVAKSLVACADSQLVAIGSRSLSTAKEFAAQYQRPNCPAIVGYSSYEEAINAPNVEAVYIGLPTSLHKEYSIKAAKAKKHVLCEKPCAASVADLREILAVCAANHVQYMDGVFWSHYPRTHSIENAMKALGTIKHVASTFNWHQGDPKNIRLNVECEPLGSLGDLGWYNIRASLFAMHYDLPKRVTAVTDFVAGSPKTTNNFTGMLIWEEGQTAMFRCSFETQEHQWMDIQGTKGSLRVEDFVIPLQSDPVHTYEMHMPEGQTIVMASPADNFNHLRDGRALHMIQDFSRIVLSGKLDEFWPALSLKTQLVLEACLKSAHLKGQMVAVEPFC